MSAIHSNNNRVANIEFHLSYGLALNTIYNFNKKQIKQLLLMKIISTQGTSIRKGQKKRKFMRYKPPKMSIFVTQFCGICPR